MPDPINVEIIAEQWNKITGGVPEGITSGQVYKRKTTKNYFWTYRVVSLGEPDPVNFEEGKPMFIDGPYMPISFSEPSHVFVWVSETENGEIEVMI